MYVFAWAMLHLGTASAAEKHGMVVRVDLTAAAAQTGAVVAHLKAGASTFDVPLKDDGTPPDVTADDKSHSGTGWFEGDTFEVSVTVGTTTIPGGTVSWKPEDDARDLTLTVSGSTLTAEASAGQLGPKVGGPPATGPSPNGNEPGADVTPPLGPDGKPLIHTPPPGGPVPGGPLAGGAASAGAAPDAAAHAAAPGADAPRLAPLARPAADPLAYIGVGVGLLVLAGLLYTAASSRGRRAPDALPEPGLVGPTTPSLSGAPTPWLTDAADMPALAEALLRTIARHRRVVVAADGWTPAPVHGGPVYKAPAADPKSVARLVDALLDDGGAPVAVLLVGDADAARIAGVERALKGHAALVAVGTVAPESASTGVTARRDGPVWTLRTAAGECTATVTADGFVVKG